MKSRTAKGAHGCDEVRANCRPWARLRGSALPGDTSHFPEERNDSASDGRDRRYSSIPHEGWRPRFRVRARQRSMADAAARSRRSHRRLPLGRLGRGRQPGAARHRRTALTTPQPEAASMVHSTGRTSAGAAHHDARRWLPQLSRGPRDLGDRRLGCARQCLGAAGVLKIGALAGIDLEDVALVDEQRHRMLAPVSSLADLLAPVAYRRAHPGSVSMTLRLNVVGQRHRDRTLVMERQIDDQVFQEAPLSSSISRPGTLT